MTAFEKKRLAWLRLGALAALGCFLTLLLLGGALYLRLRSSVARLEQTLDALQSISTELQSVDWERTAAAVNNLSAQLETVQFQEIIAHLDSVSAELAAVDWATLSVSAADNLTLAQQALDEAVAALKTMGELDVERLNTAIANLQAVVEPLAKLLR